MLKAAIKHASIVDKVHTLPPEQVAQWAAKLEGLNGEVAVILKEEKAIRKAQMELPHLYLQRDMATR